MPDISELEIYDGPIQIDMNKIRNYPPDFKKELCESLREAWLNTPEYVPVVIDDVDLGFDDRPIEQKGEGVTDSKGNKIPLPSESDTDTGGISHPGVKYVRNKHRQEIVKAAREAKCPWAENLIVLVPK